MHMMYDIYTNGLYYSIFIAWSHSLMRACVCSSVCSVLCRPCDSFACAVPQLEHLIDNWNTKRSRPMRTHFIKQPHSACVLRTQPQTATSAHRALSVMVLMLLLTLAQFACQCLNSAAVNSAHRIFNECIVVLLNQIVCRNLATLVATLPPPKQPRPTNTHINTQTFWSVPLTAR